MGIECTKCGSDQVQAVKAILLSGTSTSTGSFSGIGAGSSGGDFVSGSTYNVNKTNLASMLSPPKKPYNKNYWVGFIMFCGLYLFLAFGMSFGPHGFSIAGPVITSVICIPFLYWLYNKGKKVQKNYDEKYPAWKKMHDNGFYCHRCTNIYIP